MEPKNLPEKIEGLLTNANVRKRFEDMLGKKAAGFMSSILSVTNQNKELQTADPKTILSAAAIAASLDLPINPNLGFAYIIPYSGKAQFQMGWKGFVQLGQRSAQYRTINVAIVYEGELVKHNKFTGEMEFNQAGKKSDKIMGYVAYFRLLNGFEKYYYMTYDDVRAHGKRYSKSFNNPNSRWQQDFDLMAMKTVIKLLLARWGILSIDMQQAIQADQAIVKETEGGVEFEYADGTEEVASETPFAPDPELVSGFDSMVLEKNVDHGIFDPWLADLCKANEMTPEVFKVAVMQSTDKDREGFWQEYSTHVEMVVPKKVTKKEGGLLFVKKK